MPRRYTLNPCGSGELGAVITDLDLATIVEYDLEYLKHDWLKYKVIIIKNQHELTAEQFARLGEQWEGEFELHEQQVERGKNHGVGHEERSGIESTGHPAIHAIHHHRESPAVENYWHVDTSYLEYPQFITAIHMLEKPDSGGVTMWANTNAMYENMNPILKEKAHGKTARHGARFKETDPKELVSHPLIMVHPETGLYHLYANPYFTRYVDGMEEQQGFMLLRHMYDNNLPEFQYRHVWEKGDVAIWDNRSVWHYAVSDYWPKERKIQRWIKFDTSRPQAFDMAPNVLDSENGLLRRRNAKYRGQVERLKNRTSFNGIDD